MIRRKLFWIAAVAILIPASLVAWWLISPLFISKTVHEEFPMARNATVPENMSRSEVETVMTGMAKVRQEMDEKMADAMTTATVVRAGLFRDGDSFHKGSGQATIYRLPDGFHILRLDHLQVTNGPALHVLLARHPNPEKNADLKDYVDLGDLKGNVGNQNYPIPADIDLPAQRSVIIYCKPFQVIFSVAPLKEP